MKRNYGNVEQVEKDARAYMVRYGVTLAARMACARADAAQTEKVAFHWERVQVHVNAMVMQRGWASRTDPAQEPTP